MRNKERAGFVGARAREAGNPIIRAKGAGIWHGC
jgi:hypothetical protein